MTRKHFEALATGLANTRPDSSRTDRWWQWNQDLNMVINICKASNPAFNEERFKKVCYA